MKTIPLFASLLLLSLTAHAGLNYARPPVIDGMAGVPFGSGATAVKAAMDSHNASLVAGESDTDHLRYSGGTFNDEAVTNWNFFFADSKMYKASLVLSPAKKQRLITYNRVLKELSDKYGEPSVSPGINGDTSNLYDAVRSGKVVLEADWRTKSLPRHSITCKMLYDRNYGDVIIRIAYQDDAVAAQLLNASKKDL
jgi:hypothetical protein